MCELAAQFLDLGTLDLAVGTEGVAQDNFRLRAKGINSAQWCDAGTIDRSETGSSAHFYEFVPNPEIVGNVYGGDGLVHGVWPANPVKMVSWTG